MSSALEVSALVGKLSRGALWWSTRRAIVRLHGADARGFLHRMSTQHVEALAPKQAALAALTNKQGRLVELVNVVALAEDDLLLFGTNADGAALVEWLDGFLFVEDVELSDLGAEGSLALVAGASAFAVASRVLGADVALSPWQAIVRESALVVRGFDFLADGEAVPSVLVWRRGGRSSELEEALVAAGAERGSDEDLEVARVAAGIPGPAEVSERYNPLELALHDAIHWAKGCYIGQEVIARIDNYGKQARHLVGLALDDESALARLRVGASVRLEGQAIGELTSVSPRYGANTLAALAVVKLRGELDGTRVDVVDEGEGTVSALIRPRAAAQVPHD